MSKIADVIAGTKILAAWGNAIRDRTVTPFVNAADRTTGLPSPIAGQTTYQDDSKVLEYWDGAAWRRAAQDPPWTTFTPTITTTGPAQITYGDTFRAGRYRRRRESTDLFMYLRAGSSWSGGNGIYIWDLPVTSMTGIEQIIPCKIGSIGSGNYFGFALIGGAALTCVPYFSFSPTTAQYFPFQQSDATGAAGTGVPRVAGQYPLQNNSVDNIVIEGTYLTAPTA